VVEDVDVDAVDSSLEERELPTQHSVSSGFVTLWRDPGAQIRASVA
jgi:hypothetical protein